MLAHRLLLSGSAGVCRHLAVHVEQPAMKGAAQAAVFQPPVSEIGAAMRTMPADQSVTALVVLEGHEVLAHEPHRLDRPVAGQFVDQSGRLPVAPHQGAGSGAGSGAGDEIVLFGAQHRRLSSEIRASERRPHAAYTMIVHMTGKRRVFKIRSAPGPSGSSAASFSRPPPMESPTVRPAIAERPARRSVRASPSRKNASG